MCAKRTTHRLNAMAKHYQMSSKFIGFMPDMLTAFSFLLLTLLLGLSMQKICTLCLTRMDCNSSCLGDHALRGQSIRVEAEVA